MSELSKEVQRKLAKLEALEAGGVDSWDFYEESLKKWMEENANQETAESIVDEMLDVVHDHIEQPAGPGCGYGIKSKGYEAAVAILLKRQKEFRSEQNEIR
jgi:hypothetical protein